MPEQCCGPPRPIAASLREWNGATEGGLHRRAECRETFSRCWRASENCRHRKNPTRSARRAVRQRLFFQIRRGPSGERSRQHFYQLHLSEKFAEQHMKVVNAVFALDGVAPAVIRRGAQTALNIFAETDVFLLHFIAERYRALD